MGLSRGGHNLDFIIEKDSVGYRCEVKLAKKIIAIANYKGGTNCLIKNGTRSLLERDRRLIIGVTG
jgi:hypothetical protein